MIYCHSIQSHQPALKLARYLLERNDSSYIALRKSKMRKISKTFIKLGRLKTQEENKLRMKIRANEIDLIDAV